MPAVEVAVTGGVSSVEYLRTGSGPGLVLVHGTGASAEVNWTPLIEAVRDRFTVVAPNLSGAGATTDPGEPLTVEDLAAQVEGAAADAGLGTYHLIGHSLGAVVAAAVAGRRPQAVKSLALHAGWIATDPRLAFQFDLWARLLRRDRELFARLLQLTAMGPATLAARSGADFEEAVDGFVPLLDERILRQIELDAVVDISAYVGRITAPTLVVGSADDVIVPTLHQRELAERIADARYVEIAGGHGAPFENPGLFTDTLVGHLDRHAA